MTTFATTHVGVVDTGAVPNTIKVKRDQRVDARPVDQAAQPPLVDDPKGHQTQQREYSAKALPRSPHHASAHGKALRRAKSEAHAKHLAREKEEARARAISAIADPTARWAQAEAYMDEDLAARPECSRISIRKRKLAAAQVLRGHKPTAPDGTVRARSFTVSICGKFARSDGGDLVVEATANNRTSVSNAQLCGSAWTCPDCAQHIGVTRGSYVEKAIDALRKEGFRCLMNTTTVPHKAGEACGVVFDRLRVAQGKLDAHGSYRAIRAKRGYLGRIRAVEVTLGKSGWHVHTHDIEVYSSAGDTTSDQDHEWAAELQAAVYPIWNRIVARLTGQRASEAHGFTVVPVWSATDYPVKLQEQAVLREAENDERKEAGLKQKQRWGAQAELTKAHVKKAEKGGRTPWDVLDGCYKGIESDGDLFRDYANGTWDRVQFETTRDLRSWLAERGIVLGTDLEIVGEAPAFVFVDEEKDDGDQSFATVDRVIVDADCQIAAHQARPLWLERVRHDLEVGVVMDLHDAFVAQGFVLELIERGRMLPATTNIDAVRAGLEAVRTGRLDYYDAEDSIIPAHYEPTVWRATYVGPRHDDATPTSSRARQSDVAEVDVPY